MTPGILLPVSDEQNLEKHLEKQMGCMAGFFQIFDRHQLISGKRIYSPRRIPSLPATGSTSPSERSDLSPREASDMFPSSPENMTETPPAKSTIPLPLFDFKEGMMKNSWKLREAPRLSLDSRLRPREVRTTPAIYSSNESDTADTESDKNHRSPSVVARLMGLEALPDAVNAGGEPIKKAELRRSASESRVSRDLQRFVEGSFFPKPPQPPQDFAGDEFYKFRYPDFRSESKQPPAPAKPSQSVAIQRRSYYNVQDFFPEPNRAGSRSLSGDIEKRLRMQGIDEPVKDLETLKQILEALQLKGLLHSNSEPSYQQNDRPIVVMKPIPRPGRRSDSEPPRFAAGRRSPVRSRSPRSSPDPNPTRKPMNNHLNRRSSPVNFSPRSSPRRSMPDLVASRSPRNRGSVKGRVCSPEEDDTATTISESSISSFDLERTRMEYSEGRSLLERCDKLLHSIAAFTCAEQLTATEQQPSPVSVLESSYLNEESSPSPVKKRSIDFKEWEEDWAIGATECPDFSYVSNVVLAYGRCPATSSSDVYNLLEKRDSLKEPAVHRRLLFDAVTEILSRKRHVSPWDSFSRRRPLSVGAQLIKDVWAEVKAAKDVNAESEDSNAAACGAIRSDLARGDHGWGDTSAEMSDAVLNIERLVFKDLVVEMIRDLADLDIVGEKIRNPLPRRKLLF